jgi:hypothetical protein
MANRTVIHMALWVATAACRLLAEHTTCQRQTDTLFLLTLVALSAPASRPSSGLCTAITTHTDQGMLCSRHVPAVSQLLPLPLPAEHCVAAAVTRIWHIGIGGPLWPSLRRPSGRCARPRLRRAVGPIRRREMRLERRWRRERPPLAALLPLAPALQTRHFSVMPQARASK